MSFCRILVVEDDANARSALAELLADAGYEIAAVADGAAGVAISNHFRPHVVLADVCSPHQGGVALAEMLKKQPESPQIVFMCTDPRDARCIDGSVGTWLPKPIDMQELLNLLARIAPPAH